MNQHNVLNQPTRVLLTITALLAVIVLANWLWTLTAFWSDVYVGGNKWQTLLYYHLYSSPLLFAVGTALLAYTKKEGIWLLYPIIISFFIIFFAYSSTKFLSMQLAGHIPLINKWLIFAFLLLSTITFISYGTQNFYQNLTGLSKAILTLVVYLILLSLIRLILIYFNFLTFTPLTYLTINQWSILDQVIFVIKGLPNILLALFTIWIALTQRFQYFLVHLLVAIYDLFLAQPTILKGMQYNWGETDILAISGTVSAISMLVLYISSFVIFAVWLYHWKQEKK